MTVEVVYAELNAAAGRWDSDAVDVEGAVRSLKGANCSALGSRVAPAAEAFARAWASRLGDLAEQTHDAADRLRTTGQYYQATDAESAGRYDPINGRLTTPSPNGAPGPRTLGGTD